MNITFIDDDGLRQFIRYLAVSVFGIVAVLAIGLAIV